VPGAARFDLDVPPGGYAWWYLDALSEDGTQALALIAFVGSVFSPWYAAARRRGIAQADPRRHVAVNIALYGPGMHRWAMTERGARDLQRDARTLCIGPSTLAWHDGRLQIDLDEWTAPWPTPVRGRLVVHPLAATDADVALDAAGAHRWTPIAPAARIEVALEQPRWRWQGHAYLDGNHGARPLEADFLHWDWSRAALPGGRAGVHYDVLRRDGSELSLALQFEADGRVRGVAAPPAHALADSAWRLARVARSDAAAPARVVRTLEDGPFYSRSLIGARWRGEAVTAVHESLSLQRFGARWVQALLPFRMPRRG
jgi:carotenoid 1,2-hydratase